MKHGEGNESMKTRLIMKEHTVMGLRTAIGNIYILMDVFMKACSKRIIEAGKGHFWTPGISNTLGHGFKIKRCRW